MRLCSVGGCVDAIVSHAPNARNPDTIGQGDFEAVVAGMVCEARERLVSVCAGQPTEAQAALEACFEGLSWPYESWESARLYETL